MEIANRKTAIMLVSMVSLPIIQSTNATDVAVAPATSSTAQTRTLSTADREYLEQLIALASAHAARLSGQLHSFFDTKKNKEPYKAHVHKFFEILVSVNESIIKPLDAKLETITDPEYKALLSQAQAIVLELRDSLVEAHQTFKKNEGNGFLAVSDALGKLKDSVGKRLPKLEDKMKALRTALLNYDSDLAQSVENLQKSLPKIFEIKLSNLIVIKRVRERLEY